MAVFVGNNEIDIPYILEDIQEIRVGSELVWQAGLPEGTTFNFEYTGAVQSVELPRGKYKLQCWGAQGGTSYGSSSGVGSKGGYSEGVLTLTKTTTLYIFVGGKGSRGSSTSLVNGGWNGGGASVGYTSYNSSGTSGYSHPACGGGATDISTVDSTMSYSSGRTNRSAASLLARCIVAGGGAGGSYRHTSVTTTTSSTKTETVYSGYPSFHLSNNKTYYSASYTWTAYAGSTYTVSVSGVHSNYNVYGIVPGEEVKSNISANVLIGRNLADGAEATVLLTIKRTYVGTDTSTSTSSGYSNQSQQGGGTSGRGQYPGTQSAAGSGSQAGGFGYGANQPTTGNRYDSGAGGGGWYGGGSYTSDSSTGAVNYSGGGSGFVNTAANASYRPSEYTGLQLDSGETIAGNTSHPSTNGGTETGHSGNGYARITVIK